MSIGLGFLNVANANNAPAGVTHSELLELLRDTQRGDLQDELKKKKDKANLYFSPLVSNWPEREDFVGIPSEKSGATVFVSAALLYAVLDLTRDNALHAVAKGLTIEKICAMLETRYEKLAKFLDNQIDYRDAQSLGALKWIAPSADNDDNRPALKDAS